MDMVTMTIAVRTYCMLKMQVGVKKEGSDAKENKGETVKRKKKKRKEKGGPSKITTSSSPS
jgi:hypothetical protein